MTYRDDMHLKEKESFPYRNLEHNFVLVLAALDILDGKLGALLDLLAALEPLHLSLGQGSHLIIS